LIDNKKDAEANVYPELVEKDVPLPSFYPNAVAPNDEKEAFLLPSPALIYSGMSKKVFIIVLIGVALVVVGVVGGIMDRVLNSQSSKSSKNAAASSTSCTGSQQVSVGP